MPSVTIRIADAMRTSGYLPTNRTEYRKAVKTKVARLLDATAEPFDLPPLPRASVLESIWLSFEQEALAKFLGFSASMSVGETVSALLIRDFDDWQKTRTLPPSKTANDSSVGSASLTSALARRGRKPRSEQLLVTSALTRLISSDSDNSQVLFCEAGTGIGKTAAYLGVALDFLVANPAARVMVAVPSFALMEQVGVELSAFDGPASSAVFLSGQSEWVSQTALSALLEDLRTQLPSDQYAALCTWIKRGGDRSRPAWSMASLITTVPEFAFSSDVSVSSRLSDDDQGWHAYELQFTRASSARLVVLTHSMLAWLVKRRLFAQLRSVRGNVSIPESIKLWKAAAPKDRQDRFHEVMNAAICSVGSDAGCDRLPDVDLLIVDEAHAIEDALDQAFGVYESMNGLLRAAKALHARHPASLSPQSLQPLQQLVDHLNHRGATNPPQTHSLSLDDDTSLLSQIAEALFAVLRPKKGARKADSAAVSVSPEGRRITSVANALKVVLASIESGSSFVNAFLHWSPDRNYTRISVGRLRLDQEFHYIWTVVTRRVALVSGTLYEENPGYSCETLRRALAVPPACVMTMEPIHARWQIDPVELRMIQSVVDVDGRQRFIRPSSKLNSTDRQALGDLWISDLASYIQALLRAKSTAGGILVVGTAFADIHNLAIALGSIGNGWHMLVQRPGVSLAGLRKQFLDQSKDRRVILLAVGAAWTGFDLHDPQLPNALTDLVILNAPFGTLNATVARLRRQAERTGHFEVAARALLLVRQVVGRLVRSPDTPNNRRIHWLDARIHDSAFAGMIYPIRRFLARYRTVPAS